MSKEKKFGENKIGFHDVKSIKFSFFNFSYNVVRVAVIVFLSIVLFLFFTLRGNDSRTLNYVLEKCDYYEPMIVDELKRYEITEFDVDFVCSLIFIESSFIVNARSKYGAVGLMQVTEHAWNDYTEMVGGGIVFEDVKNPRSNLSLGIWYLWRLYRSMATRYDQPMHAALTSYWRGIGEVRFDDRIVSGYSKKVFKLYNDVIMMKKQIESAKYFLHFYLKPYYPFLLFSDYRVEAREEDFYF